VVDGRGGQRLLPTLIVGPPPSPATDHMERRFADWLERPLSKLGHEPRLLMDRLDRTLAHLDQLRLRLTLVHERDHSDLAVVEGAAVRRPI